MVDVAPGRKSDDSVAPILRALRPQSALDIEGACYLSRRAFGINAKPAEVRQFLRGLSQELLGQVLHAIAVPGQPWSMELP
jgi:hypothetical protein